MNQRDTKIVGLLKRIRPSGHECWYFRYSLHNRVRWFRIGQVTLTQARKIAAELRFEVAQGRDPQSERLAQREAGTFGELYQRYLEKQAKPHRKSWRQSDYLVRRHLLPAWGRLSVRSIAKRDVLAALDRIDSYSTATQTWLAASAVFAFGVKREVIEANPCTGIEREKSRARSRVLGDGELALIWPHLTPTLKVILLTGQRPGEVATMRREHVVDNHWWQMPGQPESDSDGNTFWPGTKNGQDHRVFLVEPVREIIENQVPLGPGFIFKRERLSRTMRSICKKLGITDLVRPHDLRRTFATCCARLGVDDKTIARILNHVDRSVTKVHYVHHRYEREDAAAMERVAAHIVAVAEGRRETGNVVPMR